MGSFFGLMEGLCRGEVGGVVMGCVWLGGGEGRCMLCVIHIGVYAWMDRAGD